MGVILRSIEQLTSLKKPGKILVLTGGSFDILHPGHIEFLTRAKSLGDELLVFLESDGRIKKLKGENRPINTQSDRAIVLSNLPSVSYVYPLEELKSDKDYEILVKRAKPDIIARSGWDQVFEWQEILEKKGFLRLIKVMERIPTHSTTEIIERNSNS